MELKSVTGGCYCKAVRFEIQFPTDFCSHCHCESCRRSHGAAFVTWTSVPLKQFRFLAGQEHIKAYPSSAGVKWDGPLDQRPAAHFSYEEHVNWHQVGDELPRYFAKTQQKIQ